MQITLGVNYLLLPESAKIHHVIGRNILNNDMDIEFRHRHAQSALNVR